MDFHKGDFVLVAVSTRPFKLEATWLGPRKIVDVVNERIYVVKGLTRGFETKKNH